MVPVPAGATTGNVVVTVNGQASNGVLFTVIPPPSISSLSPTSGAVGASVTITGTNYGATQGTSTVTFNGTTACLTRAEPSWLTQAVLDQETCLLLHCPALEHTRWVSKPSAGVPAPYRSVSIPSPL